ncbi:zinc ribbon domain-containing protein [Maridesulfovibrio ferrireducens]|uniref:FmdB family zinc ribbon protein n=1 Tax=Maridesulfovibrio ferrireducens TaxID=246191 RepID=UPI001A227A81|nr:zinc ribbon domain-containing protein [Maridesulfovibrio ferrireducens]MBI9111696.1 zinc ribbon domain-containing protein [Maridesulfovibrio ferrireducens]
MPIYEYKCNKCGHIFEELVSVSNSESPECLSCGSQDTIKLISACIGHLSDGSSGNGSYSSPSGGSGAGGCGAGGFS